MTRRYCPEWPSPIVALDADPVGLAREGVEAAARAVAGAREALRLARSAETRALDALAQAEVDALGHDARAVGAEEGA